MIARVGGDEFVVLVTEPSGPVSPRALAEHLRDNVARHNAGRRRDFALSLSIGVARAAARPLPDIAALLHEADAAMYEEKRARRRPPGGNGPTGT